jgi:hypothetical protein
MVVMVRLHFGIATHLAWEFFYFATFDVHVQV